jgi:hypothetical protein
MVAIQTPTMAEKLGLLNQWLLGDWAERAAINRNAETLSTVEANLGDLRKLVERQAKELLQLRAMFMGIVEVLQAKSDVDEAELERAVQAAWVKLSPPPPEPKPASTDPYRGIPREPSAEENEAANAMLATAQKYHFSKQFKEARAIYQQIVEQHGDTKQGAVARQQLDNLRNA